jgi:hypothetical protein
MIFDPLATRRQVLAASAAALGTAAFGADPKPAKDTPRKRYPFQKSINLWAFPYPDKMSLEQCLQLAKDAGFDGIELNYDLERDLSPKSGPKDFEAIRKTAGGGFRHGKHLKFDPQNPPPLCNLYVSMLQRLGIGVDKFSSATGTLTGLESVG